MLDVLVSLLLGLQFVDVAESAVSHPEDPVTQFWEVPSESGEFPFVGCC